MRINKENKYMWIIYKLTNQINNKVYIGQTYRSAEERWKEHQSHAKTGNTPLSHAIVKYGWDSFKKEIIDTATSQEEANKKEIYWIEYYHCSVMVYGKESGYNITTGGDGHSKISQIEQDEIEKLWKNGKNINQISTMLQRDKGTITRILRSRGITKEETTARANYRLHPIYVFNLKGELLKTFSTLSEAINFYNINENLIKGVLYHKHASTHKMIFLYEEDLDKLDEHLKRNKSQFKGKIKSTNLLTGEIIIYNTMHEAQENSGIDRHTIRKYINKNIIKNNLKWEEL